jgi:hypothetical protein
MSDKIIICLVILLSNISLSFSQEQPSYLGDLKAQKISLENKLKGKKKIAIYTDQAIENRKSFFEKILLSSEGKDNIERKKIGHDLLVFLEQTNDEYYDLMFDDWLVASRTLLDIDNILSRGTGWGNLVVKFNICNKIIYRIMEFIKNKDAELTKEQLKEMADIIKMLREHLPARSAMYDIALRYYGIEGFEDIKNFKLRTPVYKEAKTEQKRLKKLFSNLENGEDTIHRILEMEEDKTINGYVELYENPVPFSVAQFSKYHEFAWDIYLYIRILQEQSPDFQEWNELSVQSLLNILKEEYNSSGKYWMSMDAIRVVEKPEIYRPGYLRAIRQKKALKFIEYVMDQRNSNVKTRKSLTRFSPNAFP